MWAQTFHTSLEMEGEIVFDGSPLARYLEEQSQKPLNAAATQALPEVNHVASVTRPNQSQHTERLEAFNAFNALYRQLVGPDARMELDYADVAVALREGPHRASRWWLVGLAVLSVLCWYFFGFVVSLLLSLTSTIFLWSQYRERAPPIESVLATQSALARLGAAWKKSLNMVREVELVARGYRLGNKLANNVEQSGRFCNVLHEACIDAAQEVHTMMQSSVVRLACKNKERTLLTLCGLDYDLEQLERTLQTPPNALSAQTRQLLSAGMMLLVLSLRISFAKPNLQTFLENQLSAIAELCSRHADRIEIYQRIDWREEKTTATVTDSAKRISREMEMLRSSIRTLGAKSVLFEEYRQMENEAEMNRVRSSISDDIAQLAVDFQLLSHPSLKAQSEPSFIHEPVDSLSSVVNGLEMDVFGSGTSLAKNGHLRDDENNLDRVMQVYLSMGRSETDESVEEVTKPRIPRAQRIEEMKRRKIEEEARRSESMSVYNLMGELESVLKMRKEEPL